MRIHPIRDLDSRDPLAAEESVLTHWVRRAATVRLYLSLGALSVLLSPLTVVIALAVDCVRRTGRLATSRCAHGITLYFACEAPALSRASRSESPACGRALTPIA